MDELTPLIEAFCAAHELAESRFGRLAVNDAKLVADIRSGRELRRGTVERVRHFMATYRPDATQDAAA